MKEAEILNQQLADKQEELKKQQLLLNQHPTKSLFFKIESLKVRIKAIEGMLESSELKLK